MVLLNFHACLFHFEPLPDAHTAKRVDGKESDLINEHVEE